MDCLYKTTTKFTYDEYKRFNLALIKKRHLILISILAVLFILAGGILLENLFLIVFAVVYPLLFLLAMQSGVKRIFGQGRAYNDTKPISIIDYEAVLDAGFKDVELIPIHEKDCFKNKELLYKFLLKVPILDEFSEEDNEGFKDYHLKEIDEKKLDEYIAQNTYDKGILLLRRYYGIVARK